MLSVKHMSNQLSIIDSNLELVRDFNEAVFEAHDFDRLEEFVGGDVAHVERGETVFEGVDALREYFQGMLSTWEAPEMDVVSMVADEDTVMYEFVMRGIAREDLEMGEETIPAEGESLEWGGFVTMSIEGGRIVSTRLLTDRAAMLEQLGVIPAPAR